MENASKAIIIAGTVLITIILISLGVGLWNRYSSFSKENTNHIRAKQIGEFNVKFQKYQYNDQNENYVTAQDVRTIVNLVKDYNSKYEENPIKLTYSGSSEILEWNETKWVKFFNESNPNEENHNESSKFRVDVSNIDSDIVTNIEIVKKVKF